MNPTSRTRCLRLFILGIVLTLSALPVFAQSTAGSITGRVFNPGSGQYMDRVRITVEGTNIETFTDNGGSYYLGNVGSGAVRITASYSGLPVQTLTATVSPGSTTTQDFQFGGKASNDASGKPVALDAFTVSAARQMDGAAIAINEQRYAGNIK